MDPLAEPLPGKKVEGSGDAFTLNLALEYWESETKAEERTPFRVLLSNENNPFLVKKNGYKGTHVGLTLL